MTWNKPKIREACLRLMGITISMDECGRQVFDRGDGVLRSTQFLPDPVESLDDALPLMEKYEISVSPKVEENPFRWGASNPGLLWGPTPHVMENNDSPSLAVCLCALLCAGHNLKDYEL